MSFFSDIWRSVFPVAVWDAVWAGILLFLARFVVALVAIAVFWMAGSAVARLIRRLGHARRVESSVVNLLAQPAKFGLIAFGGITALGTLGIDVTALVAGLGLTGLAIGLALKEIISNALSGILVIIYKPFREGDVIAVTTFEGTVRDINLRFTTLEAQGQEIYVPNAMIISNAVVVRRDLRAGSPQRAGPTKS
jgi:small conductance mechanosensitive channel